MTKNSDFQEKKNKAPARRRSGAAKNFIARFDWDSVDDQAQEDLIVPTSGRRKSAKTNRRRDKDVGTMYVATSGPEFASKRKVREAPKLNEIPEFVADVEDDEEDGFATPSYGRTKLTRNDEELVEELATKKEKTPPNRPKRASRPVAEVDSDALNVRKIEQKKDLKCERKTERRDENVDLPRKPQGNQGKRSFLAKIQEAISTGSVSSNPVETVAAERSSVSSGRVSSKKMRWLTENATKVLGAIGAEAKIDADRPQIDVLTDLLEALVKANLLALRTPNAERDSRENGVKRSAIVEGRKVGRTVEEIFEDDIREETQVPNEAEESDDSESLEVPQRVERFAAPSKKERAERSGRRENFVEKKAEKSVEKVVEKAPLGARFANDPDAELDDDFDDDLDLISFWENLPDDEEETTEFEPAKSFAGDEGAAQRKSNDDDFDAWSDEAATKKKSDRFRKTEKTESVFEASTEKLASENAENEAEDAFEPAEKPRKRLARMKKGPKRVAVDLSSESAESAEVDDEDDSDLTSVAKKSLKPLAQFGDLVLTKTTLKALQTMGYVEPTPIQSGTIPRIQAGVDLMGQAKTGTGKTAAFMIPIVEGVAQCEPSEDPVALAVVPTRELAVQVRDETQRLAQFRDMNIVACYGGKPIASQVEKIRRGVDILVGTPGRIIDLTNRGVLSLKKTHWVVLDEADRMLDIGFRPDVEKILRQTPSSRQTLLFSATLAPPVIRLAKTYMKDPEQYDFSQKDVSADTIEQFYLTVDRDRKYEALVRLLEVQEPRQAIVFCRTKRHVDALGRRLATTFKGVEAIHGDLPQSKRDRIMSNFRAEKTKILVATDVVGRGIDVSTVSHIVNYDIPQYCDDYVHRVGRAGRMGREGVAFTLVTAEEGGELTRIEVRINRLLERMELPGFEAYSKPVEGPGSTGEPERFAASKPVFGKATRRVRRAL